MKKLLCALALVCTGGACSDVRLEFPPNELEAPNVDDKLQLTGVFCTSDAGDVTFPVKITFIVDGSGSLQFSDQNRQRVVAVVDTVQNLLGRGNYFFKIIVFNATITDTPVLQANDDVFTQDLSVLSKGLAQLGQADTLTDYQGALGLTYESLLTDMTRVLQTGGQAELGRTRYINILITDGLPDPQCQVGLCNDIDLVNGFAGSGPGCEGLSLSHLCEDQSFIDCLLRAPGFDATVCPAQPEFATLFGGADRTELVGGQDYNQPYQILQKVADIMELGNRFEVGELRMHAALVLDPLADPAVIEIFGDSAQAAPLVREVAKAGHGQYLEFYGGDKIEFTSINFASLKQQRVVRSFYSDNKMVRMTEFGPRVDTDGDGLPDELELQFEVGGNPLDADTDGDGYGDYLEYTHRALSLDLTDPCKPAIDDSKPTQPFDPSCNPVAPMNCERHGTGGFSDSDFDGLHDCEERWLGTQYLQHPDTDADGIIDSLDLTLGLNPQVWDLNDDTDQDGIPNGNEMIWHLNPVVPQSNLEARNRYRYYRPEVGKLISGATCYTYDVSQVTLMSTGEPVTLLGQGVGWNEVHTVIAENLGNHLGAPPIFRIACVRARFVPPALKVPHDGAVALLESDYHYLNSQDPLFDVPTEFFDPTKHCLTACTYCPNLKDDACIDAVGCTWSGADCTRDVSNATPCPVGLQCTESGLCR